MVHVTRCNECGAETESDDFYNVGRYTAEQAEQGDFCEDCVPDWMLAALNPME